MVSRRTGVASWIFRRDHPIRPKAMICCFFSSFKTFAMLREATYPPAVVNVLDISSESMAAFQVFLYGRFWVFTEVVPGRHSLRVFHAQPVPTLCPTEQGLPRSSFYCQDSDPGARNSQRIRISDFGF